MSRIQIVIDRVCLSGLDAAERTALVEGLQRELTRVLSASAATGGIKSLRTAVLRLGRISMSGSRSDSDGAGVRIARAIGKSVAP
jgi:predicted component of type VI protein secretion system